MANNFIPDTIFLGGEDQLDMSGSPNFLGRCGAPINTILPFGQDNIT